MNNLIVKLNTNENIWLTADTHFSHANIIKYTKRPYQTVLEMNDALIKNWNDIVDDNSIIIHIGDVTLESNASKYFDQLRGKLIYVVPGGHDHRWLKGWQDSQRVKVLPPLVTFEIDMNIGYPEVFVACHYSPRVWDRSHHGSYCFYGHSHGNLAGLGRSIDVGVDNFGYSPVSYKTLKYILSTEEPLQPNPK